MSCTCTVKTRRSFANHKYLTIIGRGWAKYRDLSVASRSIICQSRRLRQAVDLRDTDKSRCFAITEFKNCFIIRPPSLFLMNIFGKRSDLSFFHTRTTARRRKALFRLRMSRILFAAQHLSPKQLDDIAHEQTIVCRKLFAGQVVGFWPIKRKKNCVEW